ncbi:MAG: DUF4258 domain-containing protein [Candidatus Hydrogenedentes bacterium]|nr:DUF4258 domain-containing protein [Candidatus Hydrogenedentota bacterium]
MKLKERSITREEILAGVELFEVIESYPEDKCLPSYLVHCATDTPFHLLFALDKPGENVRVVTAYRPSLDKWHDDLKTRRLK